MKNKLKVLLNLVPLLTLLLAVNPLAAFTGRPDSVTEAEFAARAEKKYERDRAELEVMQYSTESEEDFGEVKTMEISHSADLTSLDVFQDDIAEYLTTHTGAWHKPMAVSATGNHVVLEDGSGWLVYPGDKDKTLEWYADDVILITMAPWSIWYSYYEYVLINVRTRARVYVALEESPEYFNAYTLWIKKIDRDKQRIVLSDQTVWSYSYTQLENWYEGQKIIIGVRKPGFFSSYRNFILNEDANDYVRAECLY